MKATPGPIYGQQEGYEALRWVRDNQWIGGLYVLVSTRPWTGRIDAEWVYVERVAQGDASVYPIRGRCPDAAGRSTGGPWGQWAFREVLAVCALDLDATDRARQPEFPWPEAA